MKKAILTVSSLLVAVGVYAQGTVNFNNRVPAAGINAPVSSPAGNVAGPDWVAQLYAGPAGAAEGALTAIGSPVAFRTGALAGYFSGGAQTITGIPAGGPAAYQIRAWNTTVGATWDAANAAGLGGIGKSGVLALAKTGDPTAAPPGIPVDLVGLTGFTVTAVIPEPSIMALGVIGGLALLLRRRK
jgi:hypothetical protein